MSEALWTAKQIATATNAELVDGDDWQVSGISIDTRTLAAGDLFVALHAERDGHEFVDKAFEAGAIAALVDRRIDGGSLVLVEDTLTGLGDMAVQARKRSGGYRVAVTGSVGKSSVKEAIAAIFKTVGPAHFSKKSYNNHWGVPLSLARMPINTKRAVFEIGMNHAGEIAPLAALVHPHVGVITRLAPAHIEALGSMDAIAREKAEICSAMVHNGVAVLPADDPLFETLAAMAKTYNVSRIVTFGHTHHADVQVKHFTTGPDGSKGQMDVFGELYDFTLNVSGAHWASNAAAAVAASLFCGVEAHEAIAGLTQLQPLPGRGGAMKITVSDGYATLLDDSYNANPVSMSAALDTLGHWPAKRKIAVLGDMLELGKEARRFHEALAWDIQQSGIDKVFCTGSLMQFLHQSLPAKRRGGWFNSVDEVTKALRQTIQSGDVVLLKGSNGSHIHKIATALKDCSANGIS